MRERKDIQTIVSEARGGHRRLLVTMALLCLAAATALLLYWQRSGDVSPEEKYLWESSSIQDVIVTVTATGTVEPTSQFQISSELSGTVVEVLVGENDKVERGQVLARLDTTKLAAALSHSRAILASRVAHVSEVMASLDEMSQAYDRSVTLFEQQLVSRESYLASKAALARARASLQSAQAEVQVAEADVLINQSDLDKACICSPTSGIVLESNLEVGQIVASSLQAPVLFTIAEDLRQMELRVDIDEADIGQVSVGHKATFTVEAYQDRSFPATISELHYKPQTVNGVVTYTAILSIDNSELLLRPGMTATAIITVNEVRQVLTVTNAALRFSPPVPETAESAGGSGLLGMLFSSPPSSAPISGNSKPGEGNRSLYLLRDGQSTEISVRTGASDGFITQILEGEIAPGDRVITDLVKRR